MQVTPSKRCTQSAAAARRAAWPHLQLALALFTYILECLHCAYMQTMWTYTRALAGIACHRTSCCTVKTQAALPQLAPVAAAGLG
jgi:hypothetical protein